MEMITGLSHLSYDLRLRGVRLFSMAKNPGRATVSLPVPEVDLQESWKETFYRACSYMTSREDFKQKVIGLV